MDSYDEAQAAYHSFCLAEARERRLHVPWDMLPSQEQVKWVQYVMRLPRARADVREQQLLADPAKQGEIAFDKGGTVEEGCDCGEHIYQFTRSALINALARLEVKVPVTGPLAGKVLADSFADALIEALDDGMPESASDRPK